MTKTLVELDKVLDIAMQYCPDDDGSCSKAGADLRDMLDEIEALTQIESGNQVYEVRIVTEDRNYSDGYYTSLDNAVAYIIKKAVFVDKKFYYYYEGSPNHLPAHCVALNEGKHKNNSLDEIKQMLTESVKGNCIGVNCEKGVYYICTHPLADK